MISALTRPKEEKVCFQVMGQGTAGAINWNSNVGLLGGGNTRGKYEKQKGGMEREREMIKIRVRGNQ